MAWKKCRIMRENGLWADAQAPEIVSASRSTDIPAFYADWFFHRLEIGYSAWTNPFNGVQSYVSYQNTRFIVFWSKNPKPLLEHLEWLNHPIIAGQNKKKINCYIQYTLNDYVKEGLEKVPPLENRIDTFKKLVDALGFGHVVWRFDPMLLTDTITMDDLLRKVENIGNQLKGYTQKLVFSFADIASYKKVKINLDKNHIHYVEWTREMMDEFAARLSTMNKELGWNFVLATCGEQEIFGKYGILKNSCVDDELMVQCAYQDAELMRFLGVEIHDNAAATQTSLFAEQEPSALPLGAKQILGTTKYYIKKKDNHDKGQRTLCGCMVSKDIGEYNTCPHQCEYCYANTSKQAAVENYKRACATHFLAETITGK